MYIGNENKKKTIANDNISCKFPPDGIPGSFTTRNAVPPLPFFHADIFTYIEINLMGKVSLAA